VGFFKDIKNARELAAEHGGMPSMREGLRDARKVFDDNGEREILKSGTPARAIVKGIAMQSPTNRMAMLVPLEIHPAQGDPYAVQYEFPAPRMQAPMTPGMEVPVKVSPDDPQRVAVQWDALKAGVAAAGGALAAAQQGLDAISGGQYSAVTGGMPTPGAEFTWPTQAGAAAAAAAAAQSPQERLAKLDSLMAAGLIDDAEYAAKRQQIIDSI
jgi:Short C-terminal domain